MSIDKIKMPIEKIGCCTFIVKNLETKRTYEVEGHKYSTRKSVWHSQKALFSTDTQVEITSPDGMREIFKR